MARTTKAGMELELTVAEAYRQMGAWKVEHDVDMAGNQIDVYAELAMPGNSFHRVAEVFQGPGGVQSICSKRAGACHSQRQSKARISTGATR